MLLFQPIMMDFDILIKNIKRTWSRSALVQTRKCFVGEHFNMDPFILEKKQSLLIFLDNLHVGQKHDNAIVKLSSMGKQDKYSKIC